MLRKILFVTFFISMIAFGVASGYRLGFDDGRAIPKKVVARGVANIEAPDPPKVGDFGTFWQAWQIIDENYLKNDQVDGQDKIYGAIKGLVESLGDPYTVFFTPENGKKFHEDIQGNFGGIGAEIGIRKNQLVVVSPLKDSPASKAGLLPGDKIVKINASSTFGITVEQAVGLIRGPEGTVVTLSILRDDWSTPKEFKIQRATITAPTIDFEMKEGGIAYLELHSFNDNTNRLFYDAAKKALAAGAKGMILDLRNNPGGYLSTAIDIAGWFLPSGSLVVKEESRSGTTQDFYSVGNAVFAKMPLVILINEGSASASEILAGSIKDTRPVKLVGKQTFGKGTVQEIKYLRDGSTLKVTVAHWVLPSGKILDGEGTGLKPDYEVERTEEDIEEGRDPQFDKALEVMHMLLGN